MYFVVEWLSHSRLHVLICSAQVLEKGLNSWIVSLAGKGVPLLLCGSVVEVKAVVDVLNQGLSPDVIHVHYMNLHISGKQWGHPPFNFDTFQLALCGKVGFGADLVVRPSVPLQLLSSQEHSPILRFLSLGESVH